MVLPVGNPQQRIQKEKQEQDGAKYKLTNIIKKLKSDKKQTKC